MQTNIYLIRHGETMGNVELRFQGRTDTELSEVGIAQAKKLGERFRDIPLDVIYSSPLKRAFNTAQGLNTYKNVEIIPCPGVIEMNLGDWEGMCWSEVEERYPEDIHTWRSAFHSVRALNGESTAEVFARMKEAMEQIASDNVGKNVAVLSHGAAIRTFLSYATGVGIEQIGEIPRINNTAVSFMEYQGGKFCVRYIGDDSHLQK